MHDPDERPRFGWRMLAWGLALSILGPVLYVAMLGPLAWRNHWHFGPNPGYDRYRRSLTPLYGSTPLMTWLMDYEVWWRNRPPLRFWQRARIVEEIAVRRKERDRVLADRAQLKAAATSLQLRLDSFAAVASLTGSEPLDAIVLRHELMVVADRLGDGPQIGGPISSFMLHALDSIIQDAERRLREFDAQ